MRLPGPKASDRQQRLFQADRLLLSKGETRWAAGEFFEEATAAVSGGVRLKTDSRCDICPDLQYGEGLYFESKCIGRNRSLILYECRLEKDQRFARETGNQIVYWLWGHRYPVLQADSYEVLRAGLAGETYRLVLVTEDLLQAAVSGKPTRQVNSGVTSDGRRLGYGNEEKGYGIGWTLPLSWFEKRSEKLNRRLRVPVYRNVLSDVEVYISRPELSGLVFRPLTQLELDFG